MEVELSLPSCDRLLPITSSSEMPLASRIVLPDIEVDKSVSRMEISDTEAGNEKMSCPRSPLCSASVAATSSATPANNQLKLSVGFEDSDEEEELYPTVSPGLGNEMRDSFKQWHMQSGPSSNQFSNDFDVDLTADRVKAIISGDNLLFQPVAAGHFVEEVFSEKKPKFHNGYLFGDVIGEGSYAKVKEVVEQFSLVRRAIKIVKGNRLRKIPNGAENVEREIRILRRVEHCNVIRLIEVFRNEEKRKLYMVMEFCMGSVQQLIDTSSLKRLPEAEAHSYFRQLVNGLQYLHSLGIVHKDIKPGNLLLSPDFVLKISDFGVAEELSMFQSDDRCQLVQGTPKFQAPELVSGSTDTFSGFKADIWSSGVTLYNMISGEYPFQGEVIMRLFDNIARQPLLMPSNIEVEESVERLIRGMLDKNADSRWSLDEIGESEWFQRSFSKDSSHSLFPNRKQSVYRPLSVGRALEQLYGEPTLADEMVFPNGSTAQDERDVTMLSPIPTPQLDVSSEKQSETARQKRVPRRNRSLLSCFLPSGSP